MPVATERQGRVGYGLRDTGPKDLRSLLAPRKPLNKSKSPNRKSSNLSPIRKYIDDKKDSGKHSPRKVRERGEENFGSYHNQVQQSRNTTPELEGEEPEDSSPHDIAPLEMASREKPTKQKKTVVDGIPKSYRACAITVYKNDDVKSRGVTLALSKNAYPTFEALLNQISMKMNIPGGVNKIYTTKGKPVTKLKSFEDGGQYVASNSSFTALDYGASEAQKWSMSRNVDSGKSQKGKSKGKEHENVRRQPFRAREVPDFVKNSKSREKNYDEDDVPKRRNSDRARSASPEIGIREGLGRFRRDNPYPTRFGNGKRDSEWSKRRGSEGIYDYRNSKDSDSESDIVERRKKKMERLKQQKANKYRSPSKKITTRDTSPSKKTSGRPPLPPEARGIFPKKKVLKKKKTTSRARKSSKQRSSSISASEEDEIQDVDNFEHGDESDKNDSGHEKRSNRHSSSEGRSKSSNSSSRRSRQVTPEGSPRKTPPRSPHKANSNLVDTRNARRSSTRASSRASSRNSRKATTERKTKRRSSDSEDEENSSRSSVSKVDRWTRSQDRKRDSTGSNEDKWEIDMSKKTQRSKMKDLLDEDLADDDWDEVKENTKTKTNKRRSRSKK